MWVGFGAQLEPSMALRTEELVALDCMWAMYYSIHAQGTRGRELSGERWGWKWARQAGRGLRIGRVHGTI